LTQIITIAYGVLVVAPVVLGLRFGVLSSVTSSYVAANTQTSRVLEQVPALLEGGGTAKTRPPTRCGYRASPTEKGKYDAAAGVSVKRFLCLAQNSSVPGAPVVDVLIRNHILYLGWEQRCMDLRRTLEPGSSRPQMRY
jgi:hypothetical protein